LPEDDEEKKAGVATKMHAATCLLPLWEKVAERQRGTFSHKGRR
jgi:hypothetical protein